MSGKTLEQLWEDNSFNGGFKVRHADWDTTTWAEIRERSPNGGFTAFNSKGNPYAVPWQSATAEWSLVKPPGVKRWLWAYKNSSGVWDIAFPFCSDESEAKDEMKNNYGDEIYKVIRLDFTETEFPE